jgi:hypothetical protein
MAIRTRKAAQNGNPLVVCVNDCRLDYGQPHSQLSPVCFQVNCAFAEMRWGKRAEHDCIVLAPPPQQGLPLVSIKY